MPTVSAIDSLPFQAAVAPSVRPGTRRVPGALAGAFGLLAALAVYLNLPSAAFRATAVVGTDAAGPMRLAMAQAAADAVTSRLVLQRASASLIGTAVPVPDADLAERAALTTGLAGSRATGREARIANALAHSVHAAPGEVPGTVAVSATDADADNAAAIATAVAEAFIADRDVHTTETRRVAESGARGRLDDLKAKALAARRRFLELGGTAFDPSQALAAARARTDAAQNRLDAIRSVLASGSPPLSDGKYLPSTIEALQNTYLELTQQLATARETLGERHTTVISLQDGIRRAAANLTAEWKRLARIAAADFADARTRETSLREANAPSDVTRRAALDDARIALQLADAAVAHADAASRDAPQEAAFRLIERAPPPRVSEGFSETMRLLGAAIAGLASFGLVLMLPSRKAVRAEPVPNRLYGDSAPVWNETRRKARPVIETEAPQRPFLSNAKPFASAMTPDPAEEAPRQIAQAPETDFAEDDFDDEADPFDTYSEQSARPPTIVVAANEFAARTTTVALAIARSAASAGLRVLLLESECRRPKLAVAADPGAEPVLVEALGTLRVALPAEVCDGLFLAPFLPDGERVASRLADDEDADVVDRFDLIVIDGGCTAAAGPQLDADGYLRVGLVDSEDDDALFLERLGVTHDLFMGAVVQPEDLPKRIERLKLVAPPTPASSDRPRPVPGTPFHASRRVAPARRQVGAR